MGKIEEWMRQYFPSEVTVDTAEYTLRDFVGTHLGYCISERVRNIIDAMEPGVHQFLPVTLKYGKSELPYFIFRIGSTEDCYALEASDVDWDSTKIGSREIRFWHKKTGPIAFSASKTKGRHLFQNKSGTRMTLISDELHDALAENNVSGVEYQQQLIK